MRTPKIIYILLFFIYFADVSYSRDFLLGDISNRNISITASFTGANIIIYGAIDPNIYVHNNIYITVIGPKKTLRLRKKINKFGFWLLDKEFVDIYDMPSYYALASNINDSDMKEPVFIVNEIGWENIKFKPINKISDEEKKIKLDILKKIYISEKLYVPKLNGINIIRNTLFRSEFELPATAQVGNYEVYMYLVSKESHELISIWSDNITVTKEGLSADLFDYSKNQPLLYGLFAALGAIVFGFIASEVFRRI